jgi:hypothetical protein
LVDAFGEDDTIDDGKLDGVTVLFALSARR